MLEQILEYLNTEKYVEMVLWVKAILKKDELSLDGPIRQFFLSLQSKNFLQTLEIIRKIAYTNLEDKTIYAIMKQFEDNEEEIIRQWAYQDKFDRSLEKVNLIVESDIIIFQETSEVKINSKKILNNQLRSWDDLKAIRFHPELLIQGGHFYQSLGLSSIEAIHGVLLESQIQEELQKFQKYEKIAKFIENLDYHLQTLFSINQIGIIIYSNQIYLIKWVQFVDEKQLLGSKNKTSSSVTVLEDLGVKIGVELKENLELGDLVIFKNTGNQENSSEVLEPLLSLEHSIFSASGITSSRDYKTLNFSNTEDCQLFVNDILARIESGILLLNQEKPTSVKNSRDMDIYIKVSMEKLANLKSVNQQINVLRDLLSVNTNPDNLIHITENLEEKYLLFIKEQFMLENSANIPFLLKSINRLNLYNTKPGVLVNTVVYLFDSYSCNSKIILEAVEYLLHNWKLSKELRHLLERPQVIAITNIVIGMLSRGKFTEVIKYLTDFLESHPNFHSQSVINLLMQILLDLFNQRHQTDNQSITNKGYVRFFGNVINVFNEYLEKTSKPDLAIIKQVKQNLMDLSKNLEFIAFINEQLISYITILNSLDQKYLTQRNFYQIVSNFCSAVPLICFHKKLPQVAFQSFEYLSQYYKNTDLTLEYITEYVKILGSITFSSSENSEFLSKAVQLLVKVRAWMDNEKFHPVAIKPLKKNFIKLFEDWYINRNLPQFPYHGHKELIIQWLPFVEMESRETEFMHLLLVKDFIWGCQTYDIKEIRKKYHLLPVNIYLQSSEVLFLEISKFMGSKSHDFNQFRIYNFLFNTIQTDYTKLLLTPTRFKLILQKYTENLQQLLERSIFGGYSASFKEIFTEVFENLIFLPKSFFNKLYPRFIVIYEYNLEEGKRFNSRVEMIQITSLTLENLLRQFPKIEKQKSMILDFIPNSLPKEYIETYVQKLKQGALENFSRMQTWLTDICATEYIQNIEKLEPVKILFENILAQFEHDQKAILTDLDALCLEIFSNQKMLIDNKKKFFKMMMEIIQKPKLPLFYKKLKENFQYIVELSDIESLYYTISLRDQQKIESVQKQLKKIFKKYSELFTPWFIYGNTYALQENYPEAILAYKTALKFQSNQSNYTRLYHNLIVAYLSREDTAQAIKVIKKLEIGIKTDSLLIKLIRRVEELSGKTLLPLI
ncbi:MAG: hypothetical protein ACTSYU_01660 [Promethearchaeota archaeon]